MMKKIEALEVKLTSSSVKALHTSAESENTHPSYYESAFHTGNSQSHRTIGDTGCTTHMFNDLSFFDTLVSIPPS